MTIIILATITLALYAAVHFVLSRTDIRYW